MSTHEELQALSDKDLIESGTKITLSSGEQAIIDPATYPHLCRYKWHGHGNRGTRYARTKETRNGWHRFLYMHRMLLAAKEGQYVDHINGNGLDNRMANLRLCTKRQNTCNRPGYGRTSKYKGVSWSKRHKAWIMQIRDGDKRICRYFGKDREEDAARAYDSEARRIQGEFAHLNFPVALLSVAK